MAVSLLSLSRMSRIHLIICFSTCFAKFFAYETQSLRSKLLHKTSYVFNAFQKLKKNYKENSTITKKIAVEIGLTLVFAGQLLLPGAGFHHLHWFGFGQRPSILRRQLLYRNNNWYKKLFTLGPNILFFSISNRMPKLFGVLFSQKHGCFDAQKNSLLKHF